MFTYVYIFDLIEKSRAFVVIIGLFGHPKENNCYVLIRYSTIERKPP